MSTYSNRDDVDSSSEVETNSGDRVFFRSGPAKAHGAQADIPTLRAPGASAVTTGLERLPHEYSVNHEADSAWVAHFSALLRQGDQPSVDRAAICDDRSNEERAVHLQALTAHHEQLAIWAASCPASFTSRTALVGAEIARLEGRGLDALRLYEDAATLAHESGFIQNEALAHERAAKFSASLGLATIADAHLLKARRCYERRGLDGKVRQLDPHNSLLNGKEPTPAPTGTIRMPLEDPSITTALKALQALSGEIMPDQLLDTLMRTAIKQAGAERGLLVLSHEGQHSIEVEAIARGDAIDVRLRKQPLAAQALCEAMVQTVVRTHEVAIFDDASAEPVLAADPYIRQRRVRSILCVPLLNQRQLIGVLYLENNLVPHVFTPLRISVLRMIAFQVAIALENARLHQAVAERDEKISRLVDANIVGIFFWDFEGSVFEANDAFLRIVGYEREDLVAGRLRWTDLTPSEWHDRHMRWSTLELMTNASIQPCEQEYFRKDGSRVPVLVGSTNLGEARHGVSFVLDLSEHKRAEEELRSSRDQLAQASRFATVAELSASIAHELNQPLQAVVANGDACMRWLAAAPPNVHEARRITEMIVGNAHAAADIIRRIRALFKHTPPAKAPLDINQLIARVCASVSDEISVDGVTIKTELAVDVPMIRADPVQIQQVMANLLRNAIEASAEPLKPLLIRVQLDRDNVVVAVRDHGVGLADGKTVFEPFVTTKETGMGMGLAICRSIIEAHGGRIWVVPNEAQGVTFSFSLPIDAPEVALLTVP